MRIFHLSSNLHNSFVPDLIFSFLLPDTAKCSNAYGFPYRSVNFNRNLKTCPKNEFFTIETVRITNQINELFLEISFKLFSVSRMKNKNNYLYLKMLLILSGDINLNPGPVNRHQIKDHKFEVFTRKGLHFIHLNINSLLPKIDELRYIAKNSNAAVIGISETKQHWL